MNKLPRFCPSAHAESRFVLLFWRQTDYLPDFEGINKPLILLLESGGRDRD